MRKLRMQMLLCLSFLVVPLLHEKEDLMAIWRKLLQSNLENRVRGGKT